MEPGTEPGTEPTPEQSSLAPPQSGLGQRIIGTFRYKSAIYREIAKDPKATTPAAGIVVGTSILSGAVIGLLVGLAFQDPQLVDQLQQQYDQMGVNINVQAMADLLNPAMLTASLAVFWLIYGLYFWLVPGWLSALAANRFFEGEAQTTTSEILRIFGFVYLFSLIGLLLSPIPIPLLGGITTIVLSMIGNVIGVREASGLSTGNAALVVFFAFAIAIILGVILYCCLSLGLGFVIGFAMGA